MLVCNEDEGSVVSFDSTQRENWPQGSRTTSTDYPENCSQKPRLERTTIDPELQDCPAGASLGLAIQAQRNVGGEWLSDCAGVVVPPFQVKTGPVSDVFRVFAHAMLKH